jgi:hypothetical protein
MSNAPDFAVSSRASTVLRDMLARSDVHEPVFSFFVVKDEANLSQNLARMYASGTSVDDLALLAKESMRNDSLLRGNLLVDIVSNKEVGDFPLTTVGDLRFAIGETKALFANAAVLLDFVDGKFVFLSSEGAQIFPY